MDPNASLTIARSALTAIREGEADPESLPEDVAAAKDDLADAFEALDGWLTSGGFLPAAWTHARSQP